jgi:predicted permease
MNDWRRLFRSRRVERELDAELRDHLERQVADYISAGLTEPEARRRAELEFGGLDQVKEICRDVRGTRLVEEVVQDLRYAFRLFRTAPGFTSVVLLTLALGIGANVAVFSLVDALLLRPLPVSKPHELVELLRVQDTNYVEHFSYPQVRHLGEQPDLFSALCAFGTDTLNVGPPDAVEPTRGAWVTGSYYQTLGVSAAAGRLITPEDDRPAAPPVAVISGRYWERRFGRDTGAIGRSLHIEGVPVTIVGVSPPEFLGAIVGEAADVTVPLNLRPRLQPERAGFLEESARWLRILARPRDGLSRDEVKARLNVTWAQWVRSGTAAALSPEARARALASTLDLRSGATGASGLRARFRQPLVAMMALVSVVLLIACVNVANLLLARATVRQREIAMRLAIGAGRGRILRQLLTESAMLTLAGATGGVLLASFGSRALIDLLSGVRLGPDAADGVVLDLALNWRIFSFTTLVAGTTTLLFGTAPALRAARAEPAMALQTGSHRLAEPRRWVAGALVTSQVSLSLLLLVSAGLFARTLHNLRSVDRGFRHEHVLVVQIDATRAGYKSAALRAFNLQVLEFARQLPGVAAASLSAITPLQGGGISQPMSVNGQRVSDDTYLNHVGPGYFAVLQTPVVLGREFIAGDEGPDSPGAAIVNEAFVRAHMPDGNPLGQRVSHGPSKQLLVVGVVKDAVYETLRQAPPPTAYIPYFQRETGMSLILHAPGAVAAVAAAIRAEVQPRLAGKPVQIRTLTAQLERSLARERMLASVATSFGVLALVLAAVGLYGLLAYWVNRRTHEIGIRVALGAPRVRVLRLVIEDAVRMLALGTAIGVPAAWALSRAVSSLLFGVKTTDAATFVGAVAVLVFTGLLAAWIPARRATKVNALVALRSE